MGFDKIDLQSAKIITTATTHQAGASASAANGHNGSFQSARKVYSQEKFWTDDIRRELCDLVYIQKFTPLQAANYLGKRYDRILSEAAINTQLSLTKTAVKAGNLSVGFDIFIKQKTTGVTRTEEELRALRQKVAAEIPYLRRYAHTLTRGSATRGSSIVDDMVQAALARALAKIHLWHDGTDLRAWLFTILHNQRISHIRRAARAGVAVPISEPNASETNMSLFSAPNQGKRLELRDLDQALGKLPEEQRSTILLVGLEGMRYEDAAEILQIPAGTVRSRLSRGREALRRLMDDPSDKASRVIMHEPDPDRRSVALGLTPNTRKLLQG